MPSALASERNSAQQDDLDNYDVGDLSDNPFATPPPTTSTNKRKERDGDLGIDEEVSVQKRARVPNVKLDEERYAITCARILLSHCANTFPLSDY